MPENTPSLDAGAAGVAGGAFGMAGTIISGVAQMKANQANMKYQNEWAYRQRQWALEDRDYQNTYNSPVEVRKRMIAAGMNPALMYGNSSGVQSAAPVRGVSSPSANIQPVDYGGIGRSAAAGLSMYLDVRMQQAKLEQMEIQNRLLESNITKNDSISAVNWKKSAFTDTQNQQLQMIVDAAKEYATIPVTQGEVDNGQYTGTDVPRNFYLEQNFWKLKNDFQRYAMSFNENERREIYTTNNANLVIAKIGEIAVRNAKTDSERQRINEQINLIKKAGILSDFKISGEEFLNSKFSGTASKIILGVLGKIGILK